MTRLFLLFLAIAAAAHAQLALFTVSGGTEKPVGALLDVGAISAGDSLDLVMRARNQGSTAVSITTLSISGTGFTLAPAPVLPIPIAAGRFLDFAVRFTSAGAQSYSATLQINSISVMLLGSSVLEPNVTPTSGCAGNPADFGTVPRGSTVVCTFSLTNPNTQSIVAPSVSVTGVAFALQAGTRLPLVLAPGASSNIAISFAPVDPILYSGSLIVGAKTIRLTGMGADITLSRPTLSLDAANIASAQQRSITLTLAVPATIDASGLVDMVFTPTPAGIRDDPAVVFVANGARQVPFTIRRGESAATFSGRGSATFQTGTTAGSIRFSIAASAVAIDTDPSLTVNVAAAAIALDRVSATRRSGELSILIEGFDNTYSMGAMSFTFYDARGSPIDPGAIRADFTADFRRFFTATPLGSAFAAGILFPVFGDVSQVSAVEIELTNAAGTTRSARVSF